MYPYKYKNREDFKIIRKLTNDEMKKVINAKRITKHVRERIEREEAYIALGLDTTDFTIGFEVDKLHPNGTEYHIVTPTGLTKIYNSRTWNLITILGTRPGQFKRLFKNQRVPANLKWLSDLIYERHLTKPINNM